MKQGRAVLTCSILLAAALLCLVAMLLGRPAEPEFQGKGLGYWLAQEDRTMTTLGNARLTSEAADAVRSIGTNAIPGLLERMRPPSRTLARIAQHFARFGPARRIIDRLVISSGRNPREAMLGFRCLGPAADPAIPDLIPMVGTPAREWALQALCWIGPDALAPLTNAVPQINSDNDRLNVIAQLNWILNELGSNAPPFAPVFLQTLRQDPAGFVRAHSAQALGQIGGQPDAAVPALIEAMNDKEGLVRLLTAEALGNFDEDARAAIPTLRKALNDSNPQVRSNAAVALKRIDPKTTANDGLQ